MNLEGIGVMDLQGSMEWLATVLCHDCDVLQELEDWRSIWSHERGNVGRVELNFRGVDDEWLCGVQQLLEARYPRIEWALEHAEPWPSAGQIFSLGMHYIKPELATMLPVA